MERIALQRYMDAHERDDVEALAELLLEDVRVAYPQIGIWCDSSDSFINGSRKFAPPGDYRLVACGANLQPAVGIYLRSPGDDRFRITALEVLRIENGRIVEIIDYDLPHMYAAFGLAATL
jgi:RNA polymerase sigma-70 factor, ECF subfamily